MTEARVAARSKPRLWQVLGPGLITGAADDDPSGIAVYVQAGAQFGFQLGWTLLLTYPLMVVIQAISARLGRTTGHGIAGNLRAHYPNWVLQSVVALLFITNTLNIGADLGAMGEAARLVFPAARTWVYVLIFGLITLAAQVLLQQTRYVTALKCLTFAGFSYFAAASAVQVPWLEFVRGLTWPRIIPERDFWLTVTAILGTTISPYLFFWQAAQEAEDAQTRPTAQPLLAQPSQGAAELARIQLDTSVGMGLASLVALAVMVTAAATLCKSGVHTLTSATEAAQALRPLAGHGAFALFALGIIGTGLLTVPVLAGSAAHAIGEARRWPVGLAPRPAHAKAFYSAVAAATLLGAGANLTVLNPITALVWVAVINGLIAAPVMALLMSMATRDDVLGEFKINGTWAFVGWLATALMGISALAFLVSSL